MEKALEQWINDARELLGQLTTKNEIQEKQLKMYQELLDRRISMVETSLAGFRHTVLVVFSVVTIPLLIWGFSVQNTVGNLTEMDIATEQEVMGAFGVVIDEQRNLLESEDKEEAAKRYEERTKRGILEIFGYKSRSLKKE